MREFVEKAASGVFNYVKDFDPGTISGSWTIVVLAILTVIGILMLVRFVFPIRASVSVTAGNPVPVTSNTFVEENA